MAESKMAESSMDLASPTLPLPKTSLKDPLQNLRPRQSESLVDFLTSSRVRDIIPHPRAVLQVPENESVATLLNQLASNALRCALVVKNDVNPPRALTFVDAYDLAMSVLESTNWSPDLSCETVPKLLAEARYFLSKNIKSVTAHDALNVVNSEAFIPEVIRIMSAGFYRALVTDNNLTTNVISQSDIVRAIVIRHNLLNPIRDQTLEQAKVITSPVDVVHQDLNVITALRFMRDRALTGVPVVDSYGRLVHSLSVSDFLGLNESNFHLLALSVGEFLRQMYGFQRPPVNCRRTDTIEMLLLKLTVFGVHRVFIVDNENYPKGIVTLTDVIAYFQRLILAQSP